MLSCAGVCEFSCETERSLKITDGMHGGVRMAPVQEKWRAEYQPTLDDVEIHWPEGAWDNDQSNDVSTYHRRRTAGLWTALASLAVVLAVIAAYGYSVMSNQNSQLAWLPSMAKSISAVRARTSGLEATLKDMGTKQDSLATRVQNLDAGWQSRLNTVRLQAAGLVNNAYQKERMELNQRVAALNSQIAEMSSRQQVEHAHVAELERQLANTRQELASMRESSTSGLAALQQQETSNEREIASVNNELSTDQVNFEAGKNQDAEIVPGVSVHLTNTDVLHQRFGGWIWLTGNRRRLWLRRQIIESPVVFYPVPGGEAYELVVTQVNQKEVAGYLLVPSTSESQQADVRSSNKSIAQQHPGNF